MLFRGESLGPGSQCLPEGRGKGPRDLRPLLVAKRWSSERSQSMSLAVHLLFRTENKCTNSLCCTWSETGCWVGLGTRLNHCIPRLPVGRSCDHHVTPVVRSCDHHLTLVVRSCDHHVMDRQHCCLPTPYQ